jgi:transposase-like protein
MKRKSYSPDFKASALDLAARVTVPLAAAQLSVPAANIYNWREQAATKSPSAKPARIYWNDADTLAFANEWVSLRIADPLESATVLAERAQRKVFGGRGDLQREIASIKNIPPLVRAIDKQWKELLDKPAEPAPVAPPPPPPLPIVLEVEVPRKWTLPEMLEALDEPAIEALLSAKRLIRENTFHQLLASVAAHNGSGPTVKPFTPKLEIYEPVSKRTPRIAVLGIPEEQEEILLENVKATALDVIIRIPHAKDRETVNRCDYAVICREPGKTGSEADRTIAALGRDRVTLLDGVSIPAVVQQVRNILSRK